MAPLIEFGINGETLQEFDSFTVDLNDQEPFSPKRFDEFAKKISFKKGSSGLKYIAINDKLYIFSLGINHDMALRVIRRVSNDQKLRPQSGGHILIIHNREEGDTQYPRRKLYGCSMTLEDYISKEESDEYKFGKIKETIGKFVEVS